MATHTVSTGHIGVEAWTLVASQVDTVTFADNISRVRIVSDGAAEVRVTIDGSAPAILADGASTKAYRLPAGGVSVLEMDIPTTTDTVRFVSSGTPKVSVERVNL